jgi:replicative DNA helicase
VTTYAPGTPQFLAEQKALAAKLLGSPPALSVVPNGSTPVGKPNHPDLEHRSRLAAGGAWILDVPELIPAVWGRADQILWAQGEPLLVVGPSGVGKSTLAHQLVAGRLGLLDGDLLGLPVEADPRPVLYLASDRPQQIRRAMRRLFTEEHRQVLDERLVIWPGPPPQDLGKHPERLALMCAETGAGTVFLDSLKDMAIGISDDEVGAGLNRGIQAAIAEGVEVVALHHQRKGQGGTKPKGLEDVFGSTWVVAGAGSVVLLWGKAGDPVVELLHLKQPASDVGPLKIEHDHHTGRSTINRGIDVLVAIRHAGPNGLTVTDIARLMFEKSDKQLTENETKKARRRLEALVRTGHLEQIEAKVGGAGGSTPARFVAVPDPLTALLGDPTEHLT